MICRAISQGLTMNLDEWRDQVFQEKVKPLVKKWHQRLGLDNWDIQLRIQRVIKDDAEIEAHCNVWTEGGHVVFITLTDETVDDPKKLESHIVHELLHVILDELAQFAYHNMPEDHHAWYTRLIETAVSDLVRVFLRLDNARD